MPEIHEVWSTGEKSRKKMNGKLRRWQPPKEESTNPKMRISQVGLKSGSKGAERWDMDVKTFSKLTAVYLAALYIFGSGCAHASLGGDTTSVETDRAAFKAKVRTPLKVQAKAGSSSASGNPAPAVAFTVRDVSTDSHTVKEYLNADGIVFAVSWSGVSQPDLSQLFGSYFAEYKSQTEQTAASRFGSAHASLHARAPLKMTTSNLTVQKWGRMRAMKGLAILKNQMPASVSEEDLK